MAKIPTKDIPQANSLETVGDLLALIDEGIDSRAELASHLGIDPRQVLYYQEAARILGLLESKNGKLTVTPHGAAYLKAIKPAEQTGIMSEAVRNTEIFKRLLERYTEAELNKPNIVAFLKEETTLTGTTLGRRADCIVAWLKSITKIDPEDFKAIAKYASAKAPDQYRRYRDTEEGLPHSKLKQAVAENPSLLGEPLTLVREEYQFPTNDRIDLLFTDAKSKFVAVEIEVDVGALDIAGLLQAAKYQVMLRVQYGRPLAQVRTMLVARSIDPYMKERAERYGIETREIKNII
ncbi:MAG TPA: endonuclease NucS domain-containing protein [Anaerolineae bacterium]|nr:endonuclease NucS domain-containing protein [Anaerolineae bacterium]